MVKLDQGSIDVAMSNFAVQALMLNKNFVANIIAPVVAVPKVTGHYWKLIPKEGLQTQIETKIGHGGKAPRLEFVREKAGYDCEERGLNWLLTDREQKNDDVAVMDVQKGDELILQSLATSREEEFAAMMLAGPGAYYSADHWFAAATAWDVDDSDPAEDIDQAVRVIMQDSGFTPNTLLCTNMSYNTLKRNPTVRELIKYNAGIPYLQTGRIPGDMVYNLRIVQAGALYDTAAPLENGSIRFLWENCSALAGKDWVWVGYVDPRPGLYTGGFSNQFAFNNNLISDMDIVTFTTWYEDSEKGTYREARSDYDLKITNNRAGAVITGVKTDTSE